MNFGSQNNFQLNLVFCPVVGYTGSYGAGGYDVWLIKTDAIGDTLWTKTYGGVSSDFGYSLKQADDGGYIIGGATPSPITGGLDLLLIRTDSLGQLLWLKTYDGLNTDYGWSIDVTDDGGIIICGQQNYFPQSPDGIVIKTNSEGDVEWQKSIGTTDADYFNAVQQITDGSYIICGVTGYENPRAWLLKLDTDGDTLWTRTFGGNLSSGFQSLTETEDKGLILTGWLVLQASPEFTDVWLIKNDSLGNVEWEKTYNYDNDFDIGYSVQQTSDGGYIIAGGGTIYDWISHGWIIKTNSLGDTLWTKYIKGYPDRANPNTTFLDSYFFSIIQMSNGDYVATGIEAQYPLNDQIWLVRIASDIVPVELTSFTASVTRNAVSLNWQTATETNNSGFEIERTSPLPSPYEGEGVPTIRDGRGWNVIGFVPGFGTTTEPKSYSFIDEDVSAGKYEYRLKQIDFDGSFEYSNTVEVEITSPLEFVLGQNYPNPFNPSTTISFSIPEKSFVTLKVYDILGNEVATLVNEQQPAGTYEVEFNLRENISLSSGVYYYQLHAGSFLATKKFILMK